MAESFGSMLVGHRRAASLTQEALAERASLSVTAVAALERGRNRAPRLSTLRQLARALELSPEQLAELARAASADGGVALADVAAPVVPRGAAPAPPGPPRSTAPGPPPSAAVTVPVAAQGHPPAVGAGAATESTGSSDGVRRDPSVGLPAPAARRWRTGFVGRERQLDRLTDAWRRRRRMVEVVGEPGIGKTRLVAELARRAHGEGATVLWGRCSEDGLGAYLPFVEALRHLVVEAGPERLSASVGGRGELTRLVPELADRIGSLPAPTRADAGTEQRLLFEAVGSLLESFMPALVVIDDLHWADDATLALLAYLVRDHRLEDLVVTGTARSAEVGPRYAALMAGLGRDADVTRLRLEGFDERELSSLVVDLVGAEAPGDVVRSVEAATEGNPFFAEEMVVHLLDAGLATDVGGRIELQADARSAGVPERVRDTVVSRLLSLSADGVDLLSVGSVIGREFDLTVAADASGLGGTRLVDAADDGLLSGLVVETGPGRLAFSHALVQDAVGERLSHARRAATHRAVAEALEVRWAQDPSVVVDLARHWSVVAAADPSASTVAATWVVRAGDYALAAAAADEAIARYEEASSLWATSTLGHADTLVRLGAALQYRGRAEEADDRFREAMALATALGDPRLQAAAAIGLGRRYPYWETDQERTALLESALAALAPGDELLRLTIMGLIVTHLINGFRPEEAARRDELADVLATVVDEPGTSDEVLLSVGRTRIYDCIEDPPTLQRVALRLARLAEAHNDLRVLAGARFAQGLAALDQGEMGRLRAASERFEETAARLDDPRELSQVAMMQSTITFIEGRYDEAAELSERARSLGAAGGDFNSDLLSYAQGLLRAVDQGEADAVLELLQASTDYHHIPSFAAGTALCAALAGDDELARRLVAELVGAGFRGVPRGADRLAPTAFLAHACAIVEAAEWAGPLYDALAAQPCTVVRVGPLAGWWGPVDHHLGSLATLLGRHVDAVGHLRRALAVEQRMGAHPFEARTRAQLARALAAAEPQARDEAVTRARAAAASTGAAGVIAEVAAVVSSL